MIFLLRPTGKEFFLALGFCKSNKKQHYEELIYSYHPINNCKLQKR